MLAAIGHALTMSFAMFWEMLGRTSDDLFHAGQVGRKRLPSRMSAPLPLLLIRLGQRLALALRLNFLTRDGRLFFQKLQLQVAQLFAARPVLGDPPQAQTLFENLNLQLCVGQLLRDRIQLLFQ